MPAARLLLLRRRPAPMSQHSLPCRRSCTTLPTRDSFCTSTLTLPASRSPPWASPSAPKLQARPARLAAGSEAVCISACAPSGRAALHLANLAAPAGPYEYVKHIFPDGNTSYDMNVYFDADTGEAFLIRRWVALGCLGSRMSSAATRGGGTACRAQPPTLSSTPAFEMPPPCCPCRRAAAP